MRAKAVPARLGYAHAMQPLAGRYLQGARYLARLAKFRDWNSGFLLMYFAVPKGRGTHRDAAICSVSEKNKNAGKKSPTMRLESWKRSRAKIWFENWDGEDILRQSPVATGSYNLLGHEPPFLGTMCIVQCAGGIVSPNSPHAKKKSLSPRYTRTKP